MTTLTNCYGVFTITGQMGDTLVFSKSRYKNAEVVVSKLKGNVCSLSFDYASLLNLIKRDSLIVTSRFTGTSQPFFIVDGDYTVNYRNGTNPHSMTKEEVKAITVFKGADALAKFGEYGKNGVIWINLPCR